jgi:hypothetical protein
MVSAVVVDEDVQAVVGSQSDRRRTNVEPLRQPVDLGLKFT